MCLVNSDNFRDCIFERVRRVLLGFLEEGVIFAGGVEPIDSLVDLRVTFGELRCRFVCQLGVLLQYLLAANRQQLNLNKHT